MLFFKKTRINLIQDIASTFPYQRSLINRERIRRGKEYDKREDNYQHVTCCRVSVLDANRNLPKEAPLYQ